MLYTIVTQLNVTDADMFYRVGPDTEFRVGPVVRVIAKDAKAAMNAAFAVGNSITPDALGAWWPKDVRSLSVADVLWVTENATGETGEFIVAPVGFKPFDEGLRS